MKISNGFSVLSILTLTVLLTACGLHKDLIKQKAQRIAHPALMIERVIATPPYALTTFERMHERGAPAHIYIGDDAIGHNAVTFNVDANTQDYAVALHLASRDKAENVAYIALPCQYSGLLENGKDCSAHSRDNQAEFTSAINNAIGNIKATYGLTDIHLIGYGSGANIAARIAGARQDVRTLRTVSGVLEHSPYTVPRASFARLQHIPQYHYIGLDDGGTITNSLAAYKAKFADDYCLKTTTVLETGYEAGWANRWNALITQPLTCARVTNDYDAINLDYTPVRTPPKTGWLPDSYKVKP